MSSLSDIGLAAPRSYHPRAADQTRRESPSMGQQVERLAQFVAQTQLEDIPEAVRRHAKLVLLDTLGVILAGAERPEVRQLRNRLAGTSGTGATVYARGWPVH